ncbi:serine protease FAM111A-like isoform X1 [Betta splendens]|uniref:Serine protease FAM111A-like isoform X1 n=1 Tax=Betta splendens TaxID=158456 RepID=A0A9W2Y6A2_BETSP|nr:serine protease FAM111A-like isoform X1 [Betta splendens]
MDRWTDGRMDGRTDGEHLHQFKVKFKRTDRKTYTIDCDQPRSVLDAIKSHVNYKNMFQQVSDKNIIIQLGREDKATVIATHFPCSCIEEGECLIISQKQEQVEEIKQQHYQPVSARASYSVFYIDSLGGLNTKTKELFRSKAFRQYKYLCVYGVKGMTVEEAVNNDGRFVDDLGDFTLSDNENPDTLTNCKQRVDSLHHKEFKICLPLNKRENDEKGQESPGASSEAQHKRGPSAILEAAQQSGVSVKEVLEKRSDYNTEEVYKILREQFPELKKQMQSRFTGDSFQKALTLRKENFGKIQQSFSEVHRVRKLLDLGRSVCNLVIENECQGTGFVLFDNFILTNAHLFKKCVEGEKLPERINVFALFNYEEPEPQSKFYNFSCKKDLVDLDLDLDYAVLELNPDGRKHNLNSQKSKMTVPPGLLEIFGPVPQNGEACLIGHPRGGVKKMDPTCIIEKERREEAVLEHLNLYKDDPFVIKTIIKLISDQGIENIMMGGSKADDTATYNTFMYHGSSGSPVFDAHCHVFGLHSAGFTYEFTNNTHSVLEYAHPLLAIFENFVSKLRRKGDDKLLKRVEEKAKKNEYLRKVLEP